MKMSRALELIKYNKEINTGFMVVFRVGTNIQSKEDYFPDKHSGEKLIETVEEAWYLAKQFSKVSKNYVGIHVVDSSFNKIGWLYSENIKLAIQLNK